jgi:transcriptional regulator with XRE-family HTH domain
MGKQIRAGRALLGWTRSELARAAGLHSNSVAYWENADSLQQTDLARRTPVA